MAKRKETPYLEIGKQGIIDGVKVIARKAEGNSCIGCYFKNGVDCKLGMIQSHRKCSRDNEEVYYEAVEQ